MRIVTKISLFLVVGLVLGVMPLAADGYGVVDRIYLDIGGAMPLSYAHSSLGFGMMISADAGVIFLGSAEGPEGFFLGASIHGSAGFITLYGTDVAALNIFSPYVYGAGALNAYLKMSPTEYLMFGSMVGYTFGFEMTNYGWVDEDNPKMFPQDGGVLTITPQIGIGMKDEYGVTTEWYTGVNLMPDIKGDFNWNVVVGARIRFGGEVMHK